MAVGLGKRARAGARGAGARGDPRGLPVYVCEYHDEALRCLHHAIRRKRLPFDGLTMVHLDAHPDLSASATMPASRVFESPRDLYWALRSDPGGISQWILPAVYGGHLRRVWWVRPPWAQQIADGDYDVAVGRAARPRDLEGGAAGAAPAGVAGAAGARERGSRNARSAPAAAAAVAAAPAAATPAAAAAAELEAPLLETIRISCAEAYFVEDGTYCPAAELLDAKALTLLVSPLPARGAPLLWARGPAEGLWTLDVCLDFFACGNPFLRHVRSFVAAPLAALHNAVAFRQAPVADVPRFLAERDAFDAACGALLRSAGAETLEAAAGAEAATEAEAQAEDLDLALEAVGRSLPAAARPALLAALREALRAARPSELRELLDAGDMVTLPLHFVAEEEVAAGLAEFEEFLACLCGDAGFGCPPAAVTLARSVVDGFCPMRAAGPLERGVLKAVERRCGVTAVLYSDELDGLEHA